MVTTRTSAGLGSAGLGAPRPHGGLRGCPRWKGRVPEAFVSAGPAPAPPARAPQWPVRPSELRKPAPQPGDGNGLIPGLPEPLESLTTPTLHPHDLERRVPHPTARAAGSPVRGPPQSPGEASPLAPIPSLPGSAARAPAPPARAKPPSRTAEETFASPPASRSPRAGTMSREPMRKSAGDAGA